MNQQKQMSIRLSMDTFNQLIELAERDSNTPTEQIRSAIEDRLNGVTLQKIIRDTLRQPVIELSRLAAETDGSVRQLKADAIKVNQEMHFFIKSIDEASRA